MPDILTRIQAAENPEGLMQLRDCVVEEINRAMAFLAGEHSLSSHDIYALTLAGNTTMVHLFLGLDPSTIRREPYIPLVNTLDPLSARELGLNLHPRGTVVIFPSVGSYLGGDLISGIGFSRLRDQEALSLLVDVGTNAEVVLGNSQWLVGCAGAAGPALEGGVARMGMAAGEGAIEQVRIDSKTKALTFKLIGAAPRRDLRVGVDRSGGRDVFSGFDRYPGQVQPQRPHRALDPDRGPSGLPAGGGRRNPKRAAPGFLPGGSGYPAPFQGGHVHHPDHLGAVGGLFLRGYRTVLYRRGLRQPHRSRNGPSPSGSCRTCPGSVLSPWAMPR